MRTETRRARWNRRVFLQRHLAGSAIASVLGAAAAGRAARAAAKGTPNPFAYDVGKHEKTDPRSLCYEEGGRFAVPRPDARRLAMGADGRLYVAAGNYVCRLTLDGGLEFEWALGAPVRCVARADDGLVYAGVRDHVEVFDAKGNRQASWPAPVGRPWLTGLAIGKNDVFVADAGNRVVHRHDRAGKPIARIGARDKERDIPGFILPSPYLDVELHRDGLLRVNNPGRHRVEAYTVEGDFELAWGRPSLGIEGFCGCCNPINLALLPDGSFVTCEKGLPRVKIHAVDGSFACVVAGPESFPENARTGAGEGRSDGARSGLDAVVAPDGRIFILDLVVGDIRVMRRRPSTPA